MNKIDLTLNHVLQSNKIKLTNRITGLNKVWFPFKLAPVGENSYEHTEEKEYGFICVRCGRIIRYLPWDNSGSLCNKCEKHLENENQEIFSCFKNPVMQDKSDEVLIL